MNIKGFVGFYSFNQDVSQSAKNHINLLKDNITLCEISSLKKCIVAYTVQYKRIFAQEKLILNISDMPDDTLSFQMELSEKLTIKRDYWGTKAIYYFVNTDGVLFSSDIRFIISSNIENIADYNMDSLKEMTSLGFIYDECLTLFKNVKQVPRNSMLVVDNDRISINKIYSEQLPLNKYDNFEEFAEEFKLAFDKEVKKAQMIKGEKLFFLSGGMDSTALSISASHNNKINTLSFASDNNYEDTYYSRAISSILNTNHLEISFDENEALMNIPHYLNSIESLELEGIFSPLGGYAYFLMCNKISDLPFEVLFPGEGSDEILGGYYWQLTHTFGFVDRLKEKTKNTALYEKICSIFPLHEEKILYREGAYKFLQGTALTNYHLSTVEHIAKYFGKTNYSIYMSKSIYDVVNSGNMEWLCDGEKTKIVLRKYLNDFLSKNNLEELVNRKKLAMPSVIPSKFMCELKNIAEKAYSNSKHPLKSVLNSNSLNILFFDIFDKYYTKNPLKKPDTKMWNVDIERMVKYNEPIIRW